jgi:hypothetical protein
MKQICVESELNKHFYSKQGLPHLSLNLINRLINIFSQKDITFLKYDFVYTKRSVSVFLSSRIKEKNIFVSKNNVLTTPKKSSLIQK